ncbi:MAG: stage IV sporulation protein A [Clostridia bacterium]|nr:stage IV sporulation protein A [Clostridia bacterium]
MTDYNIYQDIKERSGGDVYIGVVGPVRTGKSTFIKKFMDLLVIPNLENSYQAERTRDELPQSAAGRTIMTTEPKFVPNEAVKISLGDNAHMNVRMIDCVGYIVDNSTGYIEDDMPRMVTTPWSDEPMPFSEAAELGTKKVICDHSTIGILITTDGSICDIDRASYIKPEARVVNELKEINKPFVIVLNSQYPDSEACRNLRAELSEKYGVPVVCANCQALTESDISNIMETVLFEFPLNEITFDFPKWFMRLGGEHWLYQKVLDSIKTQIAPLEKIRSIKNLNDNLSEYDFISASDIDGIDLGNGNATLRLNVPDELFYQILGEESGFSIDGRESLITLIRDLSETKAKYDKVADALEQVHTCGYGIVSPSTDELSLEEPKIVRQGGRYGVRLKASAPSIHMIKADIQAEVSPIVGTEKQSQELVHYLLDEFQNDPSKIWESNIFGKSLYELVNESVNNKLGKMPDEARQKLSSTLERIINEGSGGLICIIL